MPTFTGIRIGCLIFSELNNVLAQLLMIHTSQLNFYNSILFLDLQFQKMRHF